MKSVVLLIVGCLNFINLSAQNLFRVGDSIVKTKDFYSKYGKEAGAEEIKFDAFYIQKILFAKEKGIHKSEKYLKELEGSRRGFLGELLIPEKDKEQLFNQTLNRLEKEFFIRTVVVEGVKEQDFKTDLTKFIQQNGVVNDSLLKQYFPGKKITDAIEMVTTLNYSREVDDFLYDSDNNDFHVFNDGNLFLFKKISSSISVVYKTQFLSFLPNEKNKAFNAFEMLKRGKKIDEVSQILNAKTNESFLFPGSLTPLRGAMYFTYARNKKLVPPVFVGNKWILVYDFELKKYKVKEPQHEGIKNKLSERYYDIYKENISRILQNINYQSIDYSSKIDFKNFSDIKNNDVVLGRSDFFQWKLKDVKDEVLNIQKANPTFSIDLPKILKKVLENKKINYIKQHPEIVGGKYDSMYNVLKNNLLVLSGEQEVLNKINSPSIFDYSKTYEYIKNDYKLKSKNSYYLVGYSDSLEVVKKANELYLAGKNIEEITDALNPKGQINIFFKRELYSKKQLKKKGVKWKEEPVIDSFTKNNKNKYAIYFRGEVKGKRTPSYEELKSKVKARNKEYHTMVFEKQLNEKFPFKRLEK